MLNRINTLSVDDHNKEMRVIIESMVKNWLRDHVLLYSGDVNICDIGKEEGISNVLRKKVASAKLLACDPGVLNPAIDAIILNSFSY